MSDPGLVEIWADRFALLGDPSRLSLLVAIRRAGSICVSDLATATGLKPPTVSQALRLLRAHQVVQSRRDGHRMCYELIDHSVVALLDHMSATMSADPGRAVQEGLRSHRTNHARQPAAGAAGVAGAI